MPKAAASKLQSDAQALEAAADQASPLAEVTRAKP
jgi:hypothetical protein